MKKLLLNLLLMCVFGSTTLSAWEFPNKPGSEGWKNARDRKEHIALLQIPENILHKIPTSELLDLCIQYPYLPEITYFNQPIDGLKTEKHNFNGLAEFFQRKDALTALLDQYQTYVPNKITDAWSPYEIGEFKFQSSFLELLGGYYISLNPEVEMPEPLLNATLARYQEWLNFDESSLMTINCAFLVAHICENLTPQNFRTHFQNNEHYHYLLQKARIQGRGIIDEIINQAKQP